MTRRFRAALALYSIGVEAVVWLVMVPYTIARIVAGRARARELRDRLNGTVMSPRARVLIHAVSAGEMVAAEPLVRRFAPSPVLLTTQTRAGLDAGSRLRAVHAHVEDCVFLPWDRFTIRRWLETSGITKAVVVETEIWPNLFAACRSIDLPLFIVNGRIASRDRSRYRAARWFFSDVLRCATAIGAQDERAREAFIAAGAPAGRLHVGGNLKLDAQVAPRVLARNVEAMLREAPMIVAGSTHDPEERVLVECMRSLKATRRVRMAIAPRDTSRAAQIETLAERCGLGAVRLSRVIDDDAMMPAAWDVLVIDRYGWLTACYRFAEVAFVGGTIAPVGGHNVVEAAALGTPVIVGPFVSEIEGIVEALAAARGIVRLPHVATAESLRRALEALLDDPERGRRIGSAARAVCEQSAGAVERYSAVVLDRISARESPA